MIEFTQDFIDNQWLIPLELEIFEGAQESNGKPVYGVRIDNQSNGSNNERITIAPLFPCLVNGQEELVMGHSFENMDSRYLALVDDVYSSDVLSTIGENASALTLSIYAKNNRKPRITGKLVKRIVYVTYVRGFSDCDNRSRAGLVKRFHKSAQTMNTRYAAQRATEDATLYIEYLQGITFN